MQTAHKLERTLLARRLRCATGTALVVVFIAGAGVCQVEGLQAAARGAGGGQLRRVDSSTCNDTGQGRQEGRRTASERWDEWCMCVPVRRTRVR